MTELSIRPDEIRDALDSYVRSYEPGRRVPRGGRTRHRRR